MCNTAHSPAPQPLLPSMSTRMIKQWPIRNQQGEKRELLSMLSQTLLILHLCGPLCGLSCQGKSSTKGCLHRSNCSWKVEKACKILMTINQRPVLGHANHCFIFLNVHKDYKKELYSIRCSFSRFCYGK